ncbi:MAG: hypothetical protein QNK37_23280 [Acidobacteriota bacterium]|nr:hypothetical protein [Acidobacteriota bacterium]
MRGLIMITFLSFTICLAGDPPEESKTIVANSWEQVSEDKAPLWRLAVPSGWLVKAGEDSGAPAGQLLFVPDREYAWRRQPEASWEQLKIEGGNLMRMRVPRGWIVRSQDPPQNGPGTLAFVPDRRLAWQPKSAQ